MRDDYMGIPGKDFAAHNAARVLLMDVLTGLSHKAGLKREFSRRRYDCMDPAGCLLIVALVNANLPPEWACEALNELPPDALRGAAESIARYYGVEPMKAAAEPAAHALLAEQVAKGGAIERLSWENLAVTGAGRSQA